MNELTKNRNTGNGFYNETIRNEEIKRRRKRKLIVFLSSFVLCIIGGIGIGIIFSAADAIKRSEKSPTEIIAELKENGNNFINSIDDLETANIQVENTSVKKVKKEDKEPLSKEVSAASKNNVDVFNAVSPSVVCITTISEGYGFFSMPQEISQSGSGVIFTQTSTDVYIVTNYDVIKGAKNVSVSIDGSDTVAVKMIGKEEKSGIVVLSASKRNLKEVGINSVTPAKFGNSDTLQVGDSVMAIGNALGEGMTATAGVISIDSKDVNIGGRKLTVLQTDAAINPGNSGGALVNRYGEVIGINTVNEQYYSNKVEGIGYSLSSNVVMPIIEQIMNGNESPYLGVTITAITDEMAAAYNLPQTGVIIAEIAEGSNADKAGLKEMDIIVSFNGNPVFTPEQLTEAVKKCEIGDTVKVTVLRDRKRKKTFDVKLNPSTLSG